MGARTWRRRVVPADGSRDDLRAVNVQEQCARALLNLLRVVRPHKRRRDVVVHELGRAAGQQNPGKYDIEGTTRRASTQKSTLPNARSMKCKWVNSVSKRMPHLNWRGVSQDPTSAPYIIDEREGGCVALLFTPSIASGADLPSASGSATDCV